MKTKIISKLAILLVIIIIAGCQDDWLDPKPLSIYSPESVYVDRAGMEALLLALRKDIRFEYYGGRHALLGEYYSSDIGVSADISGMTLADFGAILFPTGTGNLNLFQYWDNAFAGIRNANVLISRIDAPAWTSENEKNQVLAEGLFFRAYWYYRLVHQFGDVPFLNREYTSPKIDFYTHSRRTILDKLQEDLEFAVQWLPEAVEPGKVNRAAGYHLLTKVLLANSEWDKAIAAASAIIDGGRHRLVNNRFGSVASDQHFNVIWDLHQPENKSIATNTEAILVVQDKFGFPGSTPSGTQMMRSWTPWWSRNIHIRDSQGIAAMTDAPNNPQVLALGRGVGFFRPSNYSLYEIWVDAEADLRVCPDTNWFPPEKMYFNNPASVDFGRPVTWEYTNLRDTFRTKYGWPYYKLYIKDDVVPHQPRGGHSDWYIFRVAETHLLRAEAYYWKNDLANAAADINAVRERALANPITAGEVTLDYILDERARELYVEEPRKTELTRIAFIKAENNINGYNLENFHTRNYWFDRVTAKNFYNDGVGNIWGPFVFQVEPHHVLWPIPQADIDANAGGRINQNQGYQGAELNVPPRTVISDDD